ncbi:MAG: LacI family transcriptional regulator, partial [Chloroflexi bacterium]|nr:LacI family transcriptional regulator [Chloroflexota bacterium]
MAKRPNKVTIVDVATEAGVSFGTVSRVLNQDAHVKSETRQRVLETIHRLGYVANHQARSLASGVSKVVGVLVPDLGTGYIGEIMRGIDVELGISGHDLVLYTTHRAAAKEANYVA